MKKQSAFPALKLVSFNSSNSFDKDGIPYKMLNEVAESSRIYKHLAAVAIIANLLVAVMTMSFVSF